MVICAALCFAIVASSGAGARAQDSHYWNLHYGTRGELVSGVMVGSALDLSSSYYNPGAFARTEKPSVLLTGSVFALQKVTLVSADTSQESPAATNNGPSPSMVAGLLPMKWFGGRMGYSFLTRQQLDFRLVVRNGVFVGNSQPIDSLSIGGEAMFDQRLREYWGGVTWSKNLSDRYSAGTTVYGVRRSQRTRLQGLVQAFGADGYGASGTTVKELDYRAIRVLAKFGLLADFGRTIVGISFTTPGLHLFGSGTAEDVSSITGDVDFDGIPDGAAIISFAQDQDAEYHSPASVALGLSRELGATTLHVTTEYFGVVDPYTVLASPAPVTGPGVTGIAVDYDNAAKSVWNAGVGVEHRFSDKGTGYAAFVTDRSSARPVEGISVVVSDWNIYHVSGGAALEFGTTELTLGMAFAWGSNTIQPTVPPTGDLPPNLVPAEARYSRMKFIIGIAL
ncbi:MAG: hypothetical protein OEX18_06790 [Candidatus Krumholzibacteria bacterium]|nr:hypothetical protein [Candidatus Krumholzibacteria bacterium]MDH4336972.1 hypothetical protein [Candidatus Krumholzibacteria bacterium]MDH5269733.1 hypothetical protein [Candidatus Krumholzibacteria bacterium]MDH5627205.1 hypothetical protein [Candidatus Krumholzibacteria bacterium]